jgi:N-acyl-D-amino-acid deacylase
MTLLIKNVQIVGGARAFGDRSDVFVSDNKISAIGKFPNKKADFVLDGQGAYLAPGFIDINTDSDHYLTLFDNPIQEDFIRQGVTSIFGGMCGSSLAPLLYGSLESFQKWGDPNSINVNWHTMAEFLKALDSRPLSVNFGTMVGHSTVRRAIIGEPVRDLTKNELNVFSRTLELALNEGAFGLSTGLGYIHAKKTPYAELRALVEVVKKSNAIYATHLRGGGKDIKASVEETIKLAKETGVSTLISHFVPVIGAEKEYESALQMIEDLPGDVDLDFDIYPSPHSLVPIYTFLPEWAQTGGLDIMAMNIGDEWLSPRIKKDMRKIDDNDFLVGKSLKQIKDIYEVSDERDALLQLMRSLRMKGSILYKNLDEHLIARAIASKRSLIASNAPSFLHSEHGRKYLNSDRTTATFTEFLSMVEANKTMSLEDAVKKITTIPAKKFNLVGRGQIEEGNFADLVCFRGDEVKFTVINGKIVEEKGQFQEKFPGKVLAHHPKGK